MTIWTQNISKSTLAGDGVAAVVVAMMLIPQSLAYALLAGLPAEMGLYASILPLVGYALLGSSNALSVGPVAVVSLMTATAVGKIAATGSVGYVTAAIAMAALSGSMLLGMGLLRLGFLSNLLSHPVVSGFITASGIIIALTQLQHILGIEQSSEMPGGTLPALLISIGHGLTQWHGSTLAIGAGTLLFLLWARRYLPSVLRHLGLQRDSAELLAKTAPVISVIATIVASSILSLETKGVAVVGSIPKGLPAFSMPPMDGTLWRELALSAALISVIGFIESVSIGRTLAAKRNQRIDANKELIGLGVANLASSVSGGLPVTGGLSRSVVNFEAGAVTQLASIFAALGIAVVTLLLTPFLYHLPKATLAATIIVAITPLIDFRMLRIAWSYSRSDFTAVALTIALTLITGVEIGVLAGIGASIALHLHKTSQPHIAVVGEVPGTEHFRNVLRHEVITYPQMVSLRVDESLYFANAAYLESAIYAIVDLQEDTLAHVIIQCTAVNEIDLSALETLESIIHELKGRGIKLHLSEVKGPVMDALERSSFLDHMTGQIFLTQHQACEALKVS
ncbi:MAG: sulfate permease [Pseudomonadota bacterium]